MYLFIMGVLTLLFLVNLLDGAEDNVIIILIIAGITTFVKSFLQTRDNALHFTQLEKRIKALETSMQHTTVPVEQKQEVNTTQTVDVVKTPEAPLPEEPVVAHTENFSYIKVPQETTPEVAVTPAIESQEETQEVESTSYETESPVQVEATQIYLKTSQTEDPLTTAFAWLKNYFTTGNPMVKVGGVILFFGLSFLIKFALSNDLISMEVALLGVLAFAVTLTVVGFRFKRREGDFGLILQGIGIAIFYLAIFSGAKFFSIIPFGMALALMVATVIFATFLAVIQDAFYLAIFATVGGFLAPILTSTGAGSHVVLFGYYAFLNISIVTIAWYKSWRLLNLIGFGFTFVIGTAWGVTKYQPQDFATTEPFLIFFFLLYIVVSILFAHRTQFKLKGYVDSALVFGVPSVGFGLQAALTQNMEYVLAYSALGVSALYLSLAMWLRKKEAFSLLSESFLALGVVFLSLVFAFAFSPEVSSVIFSLESSAIIWVSLRQDRLYARIFALLLEVYALVTFISQTRYMLDTELFLNSVYLGFSILAIAALSTAFIYEKHASLIKPFEKQLHKIFLGAGLLIWILAGFREVDHHEYAYFSLYLSLSTLGFLALAKRAQWKSLSFALEFYSPIMLLTFAISMREELHPFVGYNLIALPLFVLVHYLLLRTLKFHFASIAHSAGLWFTVGVLSWEAYYQLELYSVVAALSLLPALSIFAIYNITKHPKFWPFTEYDKSYSDVGISGIGFALMVWELVALTHSGIVASLVYIPLFNPLELMQVSVLVTLVWWAKQSTIEMPYILRFIAISAMVMLTTMLARLVSYYGHVAYDLVHLAQSNVFQTSLSIMYTLIALAVIIYAKQKVQRTTWLVGAGLQGLVIVKLLLVDMSRSGSLERIISFLVVGVLILLIGFIAPLPPKKEVTS